MTTNMAIKPMAAEKREPQQTAAPPKYDSTSMLRKLGNDEAVEARPDSKTALANTRFDGAIPGYGGQVVPGVLASFIEMSGEKASCGIRVRMKKEAFLGLHDVKRLMDSALGPVGIKAESSAKHYETGYGEFAYSDFEKGHVLQVTAQLVWLAERTTDAISIS